MSEMTVHVWGFVRDGMWSAPNGASAWHVIQQADAPWAAKPAADLRDALDPQ